MIRLFSFLRRRFGARFPIGYGRIHLRRDIGIDDWEGSIGTADPTKLWPVPRADRRPLRSLARRSAP